MSNQCHSLTLDYLYLWLQNSLCKNQWVVSILHWRFLMMAFRTFLKSQSHMGQVFHKWLVIVFTIFSSTQIMLGRHWNQLMKENTQTMVFLMTILHCIFPEVLLLAMRTLAILVCTNKAFEQSSQKSYRPYEVQRNLWYPTWILLCAKGICSAF